MTEHEWLTCSDPKPMLEFMRGKASDRKLRLLACAWSRSVWARLTDGRFHRVVEIAEQFVEGQAGMEELDAAHSEALEASGAAFESGEWFLWAASHPAYASVDLDPFRELMRYDDFAEEWEEVVQSEMQTTKQCRDIFGNPFRPVAFDPAWRTSTVVALAAGIYAERAFDRMPILADALQDAGCDSGDLLNHCRGGGPHVRGCWVVDLVLGKE